jgi:hypothetical protein
MVLDGDADKETEAKVRKWSDPKSWAKDGKEGKLPVAGESFTIEKEWNMELDLAETPIFNKIEIKGILRFKTSIDVHLHVKKVLIRGGELGIGTASRPYLKQGKITLHGRKEEPTIAIEDQGIEAGSKIIANLGKLKMFGKKRTFSVTRLNKSCTTGDTEITVDPKLDLVKGDRIALAATSY